MDHEIELVDGRRYRTHIKAVEEDMQGEFDRRVAKLGDKVKWGYRTQDKKLAQGRRTDPGDETRDVRGKLRGAASRYALLAEQIGESVLRQRRQPTGPSTIEKSATGQTGGHTNPLSRAQNPEPEPEPESGAPAPRESRNPWEVEDPELGDRGQLRMSRIMRAAGVAEPKPANKSFRMSGIMASATFVEDDEEDDSDEAEGVPPSLRPEPEPEPEPAFDAREMFGGVSQADYDDM